MSGKLSFCVKNEKILRESEINFVVKRMVSRNFRQMLIEIMTKFDICECDTK